jgi:hypothetical protein
MTSSRETNAILKQSVDAPLDVKLIIHHQLPGIELVSLLYYIDGATWDLPPDQRVDFGSTIQADFNICFDMVNLSVF